MEDKFKWIRPNMDLYYIDKNCEHITTMLNSGDLAFKLLLY